MLAVSVFIAVAFPSRLGFSRRLLRSAEDLMGRVKDPTLVATRFMTKGFHAYCQGQWSDALEFNDRGALIFREECTGVATSLDISAYFSLVALFWLGDLQELSRRRRALLQEARERHDLFSMTNYSAEVMAYDLLAHGEDAAAASEVDDAIRRWSDRGFHVQHLFALVAKVRIDLYRGHGALAHERIRAALPAYRRSGLNASSIARINMNQLIGLSALGAWAKEARRGGLLREAAAAARRLERDRVPYAIALATMIRGGIASRRGNRDAAVACYRTAALAFHSLKMPLHAAATELRLAELVPADEADGLVRRASDWFASQQVKDPVAMARMIVP